MRKQKAEIKLTISLKEDSVEGIQVSVDLDGSDHEIMEIAEIAQRIQLVGEACMERILVEVLNEDPRVISMPDRPVH